MLAEMVRNRVLEIDRDCKTNSERREAYASMHFDVSSFPSRPDDPFSKAYRDSILDSFSALRGEPYTAMSEGLPIDIAWEVKNAFPYGTRDPNVIGPFLMTFGWLIREMAIPANGRILEIGAGLGSLTWLMARSGYDVTAVEINESNCEVIRQTASHLVRPVTVISQDISKVEPHDLFDCILFFEAFHHMLDHADLLARCKSWLAPGGKIVFAGEPIVDDFAYPWGLNLAGEGLRAIALWGWLELVYSRPYFEDLLARTGLTFERKELQGVHWANAYIAHQVVTAR